MGNSQRKPIRSDQTAMREQFASNFKGKTENITNYLVGVLEHTEIIKVVLRHSGTVLTDTISNKASTNMFRAQMLLEWWHAREAHSRSENVPMSKPLVRSLMNMFERQFENSKFQELNFSDLDFLGMGEVEEVVSDDEFQDGIESLDDDDKPQGKEFDAALLRKDRKRQNQLDLLHNLLTHVVESPHFIDNDTFSMDQEQIRNVQSKIASTHMALRMGRNRDGHRPIIVGQESIGKSTFINFLVKPSGAGDSALPVAEGMGTAMLTIVKHGEAEVCMVDDEVITGRSSAAALKEANAKAHKGLSQKRSLAQNSITKLIVPFQNPPPQPVELVDVPGLKDDTRHENVLAFGASSCIVLCAGSKKELNDALHQYELKEMCEMYDDLGTNPPILCCVTRLPRETFDQDEHGYEQVIRGAFRGVKQVKVMYANCVEAKSTGGQAAVDQIVSNFFKSVFEFGNPVKDVEKAYSALNMPLSTLFNQIDSTVKKNDGCVAGSVEHSNFETAYNHAMDQVRNTCMKNMQKVTVQKGWISERNPCDIVRQAGARDVPNLKFYSMVVASGRELATAADRLFIIENALMDFRIALYSAALKVGAQMFSWLWDSCKPILNQIMFNEKTLAPRFEETRRKKLGNYKTFTDRSLPLMLAESVRNGVKSDRRLRSNSVDFDEEMSLADWSAKSDASIEYFSDRGRTPWLMVGYYGCVTDWKLKTELLEEEVSALSVKSEIRNMADFPVSATATLVDFQKIFSDQLRKMQGAETQNMKAEPKHSMLVNCCIETAEFLVSRLNNSELLSLGSPLASTMIGLSYAMLQRLLLTYSDGAVTWTPFGHELVRSHRAPDELIKAARQGPGASIAFERAKMLMESESVSDAGQQRQTKANSQMEAFLTQYKSRKSAMESLSNGTDSVLLVASTDLTNSTLNDIQKAVQRHSPNINPKFYQCKVILKKRQDLSAVVQTMHDVGAAIVVYVRPHHLQTSDLHDPEPDFFQKLQGILTVSTLIVVSRRDFTNQKKWMNALKENVNKPDEINFVPMPRSLEESGEQFLLPPDALETLAAHIAEGWGERDSLVEARKKRVEEDIQQLQMGMTKIIKEYVQLKDVVPEATDLYSTFKTNRAAGKADSKWGGGGNEGGSKIAVPKDEKLFADEPFVEEIVATVHDEKVRHTKELTIRQFFFRIILSQVMANAKKTGERLYDEKVKDQIKCLIPKTFGITVDQFTAALQKQVNQAKESDAGIVDDADSIPALFLHREHFINMFVGGCVLAVCPLLHGVMLPRLKPEDKGPASAHEFDEHKAMMLDYFKSLTKFGSDDSEMTFMDRLRNCVPPRD